MRTLRFKKEIAEALPRETALYTIKNLNNGKLYIGSSDDLKQRFRYLFSCLKHEMRCPKDFIQDYHNGDQFIFYWMRVDPRNKLELEKKLISKKSKIAELYNIYWNDNKKRQSVCGMLWESRDEILAKRRQANLSLNKLAEIYKTSSETIRRIVHNYK